MENELLKDFIEVGEKVVDGLHKDLNGKKLDISNIIDQEGNQYINLVQQGGGVLGIALLGYTYVLERMGIRFLKLAGTSAGAINTMLMAVVRPKNTEILKTPIILNYLSKKKLFDFVDGTPIARWITRNIIVYKDYIFRTTNSIKMIFILSLLLIFFSTFLLWQNSLGLLSLNLWILIAYTVGLVIFSKGRVSDGTIKDFLRSLDAQKYFLGAIAFLIFCWWLITKVPTETQYYFESVMIIIPMAYAFIMAGSNKYLKFFQITIGVILLTVLFLQILNRFYTDNVSIHSGDGFLKWFTTSETKQIPPFLFVSVAGTSLFIFFMLLVVLIAYFLLQRFIESHYGINKGDEFLNWVTEINKDGKIERFEIPIGNDRKIIIENEANGVETLRDFENKLNEIPKLKRKDTNKHLDEKTLDDIARNSMLKPSVTFITSEIITQNKIEFPKMWDLFYDTKDNVNPADFVRASMSIPIFFEAFKIKNLPKKRDAQWLLHLKYKDSTPDNAVFCDGGLLSNFPINIFFEQGQEILLPTFGVRLDDSSSLLPADFNSLGSYTWSMFNTTRYYYDKDFLIKHPHFEECIASIDVREFNWLNFNLDDNEKLKMFKKGAETAAEFLKKFEWTTYKSLVDDYKKGDIIEKRYKSIIDNNAIVKS